MVIISITKNKDIYSRIKELAKNIYNLNKINSKDTIDLNGIEWVTPLSILPIAFKISNLQIERIKIQKPKDDNIRWYLDTILFPEGTSEPELIHWGETYLPITRVVHNGEQFPPEILESVNEKYGLLLNSLLEKNIYKQAITDSLQYFLGEMIANVVQHSYAKELWILSQHWKRSEELEICLLDNGIGFYSSYIRANIPVNDHVEAIAKAVSGISTKKIEQRGRGLSDSIRLITESPLNGEFLIISGDAGYLKIQQNNEFLKINEFNWEGVIIMIRVKKPHRNFEIYDYLTK